MASRTKASGRRRSGKASAPSAKPRAKSKALSMHEAVRRESWSASIFERQMALLRALVTWSPASLLVGQHAAFWGGFANGGDAPVRGLRKPPGTGPRRSRAHSAA